MSAPRAAQAPPTPVTPVDGETAPLDAVTFRWSAPPGPAAFGLRVAAAAAPTDVLVELADLPTTEATLADALPPGPTIWWVRREGGPWSAPARFVAGTPADVEAAEQSAAAAHQARRTADRAARRLPASIAPLPEAPPDPVWPHAEGEALDGAPDVDWSAVPGFGAPDRADVPRAAAEPPRPLGPLGGEVVDAVTVSLRWTPVRGADGYDVELSPHPGFGRDVLTLHAGAATEIALPGLVPAVGRRLLWRVRARVGGAATAWSRYGRFYPAGDAAVERFRGGLDDALAAQRRQRDHARLAKERELDLLPLHERPDAVTTTATLAAVLGMLLSGLVIIALATLYAVAFL